MLTYDDVRRFAETLGPEYLRVFRWADNEAQVIEDTLEPEFQVASEILDVFWSQAARMTGKPWARDMLPRPDGP